MHGGQFCRGAFFKIESYLTTFSTANDTPMNEYVQGSGEWYLRTMGYSSKDKPNC